MDLTALTTLIVLALLTIIIFSFAFVVFRSIHSAERTMVLEGKRDEDILKDKDKESKKSYKVTSIVTDLFSGLIAALALGFMIFSVYVNANGQQYYLNGKGLIVVASNSMKALNNDGMLAEKGGYLPSDYASLEFSRGDVLTLSEVPDQQTFETFQTNSDGTLFKNKLGSYVNDYLYNTVIAYRNDETGGVTIIHRLVYIGSEIDETTQESHYYYIFRGDNNPVGDAVHVVYGDFKGIYQASNGKANTVGYFILFFQSGFGMYAVFSSIVMIVLSDVYSSMIQKDYDKRWEFMDSHRLVLYSDIHDIHVKVQAGWADERYELRQKFGELKERTAENHEELKNKVEEHHEEVKAKVEQHHEEVKAHIEEKKTEAIAPVKPAAVEQPAPVEKPAPQPAPVVQPKPEEPKPAPKVEEPKPKPMPEEPKPMPKKVFGKHGVYVKIVKSEEDQEDQPAGVAIKK